MFHKCKITVIKRACDMELVHSYTNFPDDYQACNRVEDNQEFIVSNPFELPENLCAFAWADIRPQILAIASGSSFPQLRETNMALATCTDLFRPVIFKIERVDDEEM